MGFRHIDTPAAAAAPTSITYSPRLPIGYFLEQGDFCRKQGSMKREIMIQRAKLGTLIASANSNAETNRDKQVVTDRCGFKVSPGSPSRSSSLSIARARARRRAPAGAHWRTGAPAAEVDIAAIAVRTLVRSAALVLAAVELTGGTGSSTTDGHIGETARGAEFLLLPSSRQTAGKELK